MERRKLREREAEEGGRGVRVTNESYRPWLFGAISINPWPQAVQLICYEAGRMNTSGTAHNRGPIYFSYRLIKATTTALFHQQIARADSGLGKGMGFVWDLGMQGWVNNGGRLGSGLGVAVADMMISPVVRFQQRRDMPLFLCRNRSTPGILLCFIPGSTSAISCRQFN